MRGPAPDAHMALAKSPRPSAERTAARSKGETKKALARCALVMFDAMELRANGFGSDFKRRGQILADAGELLHHAQAIESESRHAQGEAQLGAEARPGIARDGDVIDFGELHAGAIEAVLNRADGQSRGVLHAIEALFLDSGDQATVDDDGRGRRWRDRR